MALLFANNAISTLSGAHNNSTTTLNLNSGDGAKFPSPTGSDYFLVTLIGKTAGVETSWEICKCTARSTDSLTVVRAQEGTSAGTWASGSPVELRITAASVQPYDAQLSSLICPNSQSANYTTVLTDGGKCIYHPAADTTARTWVIDSNANVPYPNGTAITFDNDYGAGAITVAITSDTLVKVGTAGTTGGFTIASGGRATFLKVSSTRWRWDGVGTA